MVLAANALIPTVAFESRAKAVVLPLQHGVDQPGAVRQVFNGITQWPDIDQLLAAKSEQLIIDHGVGEFVLAGGTLRPNGRPSFGSPSSVAYEILSEVINTHDGLQFSDSSGVHWVMTTPDSSSTSRNCWKGMAIGCDFAPRLLESEARKPYLQTTKEKLGMLVESDRATGATPGPRRARAAAAYERLQLLDLAVEMIPTIYAASKNQNCQTVRLDVTELAHASHGNDSGCFPAASEKVFEALTFLSTIRTQLLEIPKAGWCPTPRQSAVAVQRVRRLTGKEVCVRLDRIFVQFLDHWLASGDTQNRPSTLPRLSQPINEGVLHV